MTATRPITEFERTYLERLHGTILKTASSLAEVAGHSKSPVARKCQMNEVSRLETMAREIQDAIREERDAGRDRRGVVTARYP